MICGPSRSNSTSATSLDYMCISIHSAARPFTPLWLRAPSVRKPHASIESTASLTSALPSLLYSSITEYLPLHFTLAVSFLRLELFKHNRVSHFVRSRAGLGLIGARIGFEHSQPYIFRARYSPKYQAVDLQRFVQNRNDFQTRNKTVLIF